MLLPRLVHAWKAVPKARDSLTESPAVTARRFYYDDLVFDPLAIRFLVESFGSSQIVLGTDYPFAMGEPDPLGTLEKAGLDAATVVAITSLNAKRFLNLK
jgi:aminocarboxymuconate-semialdehyde decarboxylase